MQYDLYYYTMQNYNIYKIQWFQLQYITIPIATSQRDKL